jgi:hypothetical protein
MEKNIYHKFNNTLLPGVSDNNKLNYSVNWSTNCLKPFVISVQSLQESLIDKIIIDDDRAKSKLILRKKNDSRKKILHKRGRNFSSLVDFDPNDLTIVDIQMNCNDLSILVYLLLESILKINQYRFDHFDQECENFQGVYGQNICWKYVE